MNNTNRARLLAATALVAFASLAQAQYMWIDEKGIKQFSDRAPPASVPLKNILKAPRGVPSAANMPAEPPAAEAAAQGAKPKEAPSLADRNADFNKRAKETAEREKKEKEEQQVKRDKMENCARALAARDSLDSGVRINQPGKDGERSFMSDEQRDAERAKVNNVLAACK
jgi:hypothetical protein